MSPVHDWPRRAGRPISLAGGAGSLTMPHLFILITISLLGLLATCALLV